MSTLQIILKEFKQQIRDWRTNAVMVLFPIVLMAVLGAALAGAFNGRLSLSNVRVLYADQSAAGSGNQNAALASAFAQFIIQAEKTGIKFVKAENEKVGLETAKDATYACFVLLAGRQITLYENTRSPTEAGIVKSMLTAFLLRYNARAAIALTTNSNSPTHMQAESSYVETRSLASRRTPTSTDFYAVTMLTLIVMYAALVGTGRARMELVLKTANRILCAPVARTEFLAGKILGALLSVAVQMTVVLAFSHYVLGAYWGHDLLTVALLILAESIMAVSIGIGVTYLLPSGGTASAALNIIIPVFVFFGGGYVPLDMLGPTVGAIGAYTPVNWVNKALFAVIYDSDYSPVGNAFLATGCVTVLFVAVSALFSRKETT